MEDCGGGCLMLWRNGRRFREVLNGGRMSGVNGHGCDRGGDGIWGARLAFYELVATASKDDGIMIMFIE